MQEPAETDLQAASVPSNIKVLLQKYSPLFEIPTELPPSRAYNHQIPLILGAQPVFTRPYRYPPGLKDEIERQVADMLAQGLIQPSISSFSSPVLLVKKKDGSYRFCVDFRQLNAITAKSKFPVLVFDQLMDELTHASWFSNLDLRAGFHQILLHPGEEHKTAFQTHLGQYEFRVMAFGFTGAPGTFQGAMNITLAPGLRKFVIVFFDDILVYSRTYEEHLIHLEAVFSGLWLTVGRSSYPNANLHSVQWLILGTLLVSRVSPLIQQKFAQLSSGLGPSRILLQVYSAFRHHC